VPKLKEKNFFRGFRNWHRVFDIKVLILRSCNFLRFQGLVFGFLWVF